ncbi:eCIS core domain-containing protein [Urechidicola croceus]|uniref:eCIS core domain-containing protein n=1 Tax=Urechidicola croceus TaxID=1850246 RepID=A0A1D8P820_9FLAO|nr:DUF4157 domain-containing protein [Urechidicola croceus]AOW20717.1 hypothetical protein LPB138_08520 [Urechidicola croceus]
MRTQSNKSTENKNQLIAPNVTQKKSVSNPTFQFVDNRPEAIIQSKLQKMTENYSKNNIQKQELEEEELLQGKFKTTQLQGIENEELLQGKFETIQKKENNTGLPDNLKSGIENMSGIAMDDVKVHYNSDKPSQLQAHAYAQGTDIHLGPGQEKHLPHEAWHVVQQKQGRVKPTMQMKGKININDDAGLEKEADVMGAKAVQFSSKDYKGVLQTKKDTGGINTSSLISGTIQRAPWANIPAKFRTDNGMDNVPNSEYFVGTTSYKRYAPINEIRSPGQIFHEGPRSFVYINSGDNANIAYKKTIKALPDQNNNQRINLINGKEKVSAYLSPANGRDVWDGDVNDDGTVTSRHPGHTVINLGQVLPNLDNKDSQKLARYKQEAIHKAQIDGLIGSDEILFDQVYDWIDTNYSHIKEQDRDNIGMKYLLDHPEVFQEIQDAKDAGQMKYTTEKSVEKLWNECHILENIDKTNPDRTIAFYKKVSMLQDSEKDTISLLRRSHISRFWVSLESSLKTKVISALNKNDTEMLLGIKQIFT